MSIVGIVNGQLRDYYPSVNCEVSDFTVSYSTLCCRSSGIIMPEMGGLPAGSVNKIGREGGKGGKMDGKDAFVGSKSPTFAINERKKHRRTRGTPMSLRVIGTWARPFRV